MRDTKGRLCWRLRGHDIEEFYGIVERHGCYKRDLQKFAEALRERRKAEAKEPLLAPLEESGNVTEMPKPDGGKRKKK